MDFDNNPTELDGRLKHAVQALRETTNTPGTSAPPEELIRRTIDKAQAAARDEETSSLKRNWQMKMVKRFSVAAGVGLLLSGASLWLVWGGGGARVAFADVLEQVKQARAVRCHVVTIGPNAPPDGHEVSQEMLMVDPGWMVVEETIQGKTGPTTEKEAGTLRIVMNWTQKKMLMLTHIFPQGVLDQGKHSTIPGSKEAVLVDIANMPPEKQMPSLLDQFKNVDGKDSQTLGEKDIDGIKTKGFEVVKDGKTLDVWADETTDHPVLAVIKLNIPTAGSFQYTYSDFDWAPDYDPTELSLDPPAGYTLHKSRLDVSETTEADIVPMLKALAELNDGHFPASLGMKDFMPALQKWIQANPPAGKTPTNVADMMQKFLPVTRAWNYINNPTYGTDWQYAGDAVTAGEKNHIILWYKPAGNPTTWRAFAADFTAHDLKESDLPPNGHPVKLDLTAPAIVK
jgi:hypothetical protein